MGAGPHCAVGLSARAKSDRLSDDDQGHHGDEHDRALPPASALQRGLRSPRSRVRRRLSGPRPAWVHELRVVQPAAWNSDCPPDLALRVDAHPRPRCPDRRCKPRLGRRQPKRPELGRPAKSQCHGSPNCSTDVTVRCSGRCRGHSIAPVTRSIGRAPEGPDIREKAVGWPMAQVRWCACMLDAAGGHRVRRYALSSLGR